jgi:hypothetical protein
MGKFCRSFAPVSPSSGSLIVRLRGKLSIPNETFWKIEFPSMRYFVPVESNTPARPLNAITLPDMTSAFEELSTTPSSPLPTGWEPVGSLPIQLP